MLLAGHNCPKEEADRIKVLLLLGPLVGAFKQGALIFVSCTSQLCRIFCSRCIWEIVFGCRSSLGQVLHKAGCCCATSIGSILRVYEYQRLGGK